RAAAPAADAEGGGEQEPLAEQREELRAAVARLILSHAPLPAGDGRGRSLPLSKLGFFPEVQRHRSGLGTLRRALERMSDTFEVVQPEGKAAEVRLQDAAELPPAAQGVESHLALLRAAVLARLRDSEEQALPLTVLGAAGEVRDLRKGLGSLSKVLRHFGDAVELVEEGDPAELMVRLLPSASGSGQDARRSEGRPSSAAPPAPECAVEAVAAPGLSSEVKEEWSRARCRVVAVLQRSSWAGDIVAVVQPLAGRQHLKVQPRDRRMPAFWVVEEDLPGGAAAHAEAGDAEGPPKARGEARRLKAQAAGAEARARSVSREQLVRAVDAEEHGQGGGVLCVVRAVDWPRESLSPRARVTEVLGPLGSAAAESDALLAFYGLEWRGFDQAAEDALREEFPTGDGVVAQELAAGRADMRQLRCITIDPPNAKDLDDAVSVVPGPRPGTFRIGVHVADVTHFVRPDSAIDAEARRRATTVYLITKVYPMLPRRLSEGLCSLLPDGDRLSFSVFFTLDGEGNLVPEDPPWIQKAVIRTCTRLDYHQVDAALDGGPPDDGISQEVLGDLRCLEAVTAARRKLRIDSGSVVLERRSPAFKTDSDGRVEGLELESTASASHRLIEELMVLANHIVALRLVEGGAAAAAVGGAAQEASVSLPLLRRHKDSESKVRQKVFEVLPGALRSEAPQNTGLQELLQWCKERMLPQTYEAVCSEVLTEFEEAEYFVAEVNDDGVEDEQEAPDLAHWALALPAYMHFTSPIRRYADVLVHRRLAYMLEQEASSRQAETRADHGAGGAAVDHGTFLEGLKEAANVCNAKKRDAQDAQIDAIQLALSEHVSRSGGVDVEDAVVTRILLPRLPDARELEQEAAHPPQALDEVEASRTFKERIQKRTIKEALEFYIPLAQCSRSVSFEALGIELVPGSDVQQGDGGEGPARPPGKAGGGKSGSASEAVTAVSSVRVRAAGRAGPEVELRALEPLTVRLVAEQTEALSPRRWTVRFPWAAGPPGPRSRSLRPASSELPAPVAPSGSGAAAPPPPPPPPPSGAGAPRAGPGGIEKSAASPLGSGGGLPGGVLESSTGAVGQGQDAEVPCTLRWPMGQGIDQDGLVSALHGDFHPLVESKLAIGMLLPMVVATTLAQLVCRHLHRLHEKPPARSRLNSDFASPAKLQAMGVRFAPVRNWGRSFRGAFVADDNDLDLEESDLGRFTVDSESQTWCLHSFQICLQANTCITVGVATTFFSHIFTKGHLVTVTSAVVVALSAFVCLMAAGGMSPPFAASGLPPSLFFLCHGVAVVPKQDSLGTGLVP
ncbi:unnamed protein product, partial [Prorocentrum cordatum]